MSLADDRSPGARQQRTIYDALPPLAELLAAGDKEVWLVRLVRSPLTKEEHRTAAPWSVSNRRHYLEAPAVGDVREIAPLHAAAELGFCRLCFAIVAGGARADLPDAAGRTALMVASSQGHETVTKVLIDGRASLDAADARGLHPLHHAAESVAAGAAGAVRLLLAARAATESRDAAGRTPLMLAAGAHADSCVSVLLEGGARVEAVDPSGCSALSLAGASRRGGIPRSWAVSSPARRCVAAVGSSAGSVECFSAGDAGGGSQGAVLGDVAPRKRYPRFANTGESGAQRLLLAAERAVRMGPPTPPAGALPLGVFDRERVRAADRLLC